jgi:hypothetical protein
MTSSALACGERAPIRFDRKKYFAVQSQAEIEEFLSLFHRYAYIYKPVSGGSWLSADDRWQLTDSEILKAIALAHPKYLLGSRSGTTSRVGIIDIDAGSPYHNKEKLHALIEVLTNAGLTEPALYRSSHSGGWHIYLFFEQSVPSRELQVLLEQLLRAAGFSVQKGKLEVFPNRAQNSVGYGIRLPLQSGFAWLDSQTLDIECQREGLSSSEALQRYMSDLRNFSNAPDQYEQFKRTVKEQKEAFAQIDEQLERALTAMPRAREAASELALAAVVRVFKTPPPGIDCEIWWRGRCYLESGLTGPNQRADALFCLGHYLFYGDPEHQIEPLGYGFEEERRHAIESILALKNNGHSRDLNRGRADAIAQVGRAAHWRPEHRRSSTDAPRYRKGVPIAWLRHNGNLKADTAQRIKSALDEFVAAAKPFTVKELLERAKVKSLETLYAHKALWHQIYEHLKGLPPGITDKYNAVVGAAAPQSGSQPHVYVQDMPPGRLAARAVVAALSNRTRQDNEDRQKYIDLISDRYILSWRSKAEAAMPRDIAVADARVLKTCLPILSALLMRAPDEEHQIWLQEKLQIIRSRLDELRETFAATQLPEAPATG